MRAFSIRLNLRSVVLVATVLSMLLAGRSLASDGNQPDRLDSPEVVAASLAGGEAMSVTTATDNGARKTTRITSDLDKLHRVDAIARAAGAGLTQADTARLPADLASAVQTGTLLLDGSAVQVFVEAADPSSVVGELTRLGMRRLSDDYGIVQGYLPIASLGPATSSTRRGRSDRRGGRRHRPARRDRRRAK
jgi:hypothetical protein